MHETVAAVSMASKESEWAGAANEAVGTATGVAQATMVAVGPVAMVVRSIPCQAHTRGTRSVSM